MQAHSKDERSRPRASAAAEHADKREAAVPSRRHPRTVTSLKDPSTRGQSVRVTCRVGDGLLSIATSTCAWVWRCLEQRLCEDSAGWACVRRSEPSHASTGQSEMQV